MFLLFFYNYIQHQNINMNRNQQEMTDQVPMNLIDQIQHEISYMSLNQKILVLSINLNLH